MQISSETISVTNTVFVGEGVVMIVAAWTHLRGGGLGKFATRRGRSVSEQKIPRNSFNKTTVNVY